MTYGPSLLRVIGMADVSINSMAEFDLAMPGVGAPHQCPRVTKKKITSPYLDDVHTG